MQKVKRVCAVLLVGSALGGAAGSARADLYAYEPFLIGSNRANNEYGPVSATVAQNDIRTFGVTGALGFADSTGTQNAWTGTTSNYLINATQRTDADVPYEQGGSLRWGGTSNATPVRSVTRALKPYAESPTYFASVVMNRESWSASSAATPIDDVVIGFTNGSSGSNLQGVFVGYEADRGAGTLPSLVLKAGNVGIAAGSNTTATVDRDLTGTNSTFNRTYTAVMKIEANLAGDDTITYWVDDDVTTIDWSSEAAATATARYTGSFTAEAMNSLTAIDQVALVSPARSGVTAFDEIRFGTDLQSVTGVPEPGTAGVAGAAGLLLAARRRRRAPARA